MPRFFSPTYIWLRPDAGKAKSQLKRRICHYILNSVPIQVPIHWGFRKVFDRIGWKL